MALQTFNDTPLGRASKTKMPRPLRLIRMRCLPAMSSDSAPALYESAVFSTSEIVGEHLISRAHPLELFRIASRTIGWYLSANRRRAAVNSLGLPIRIGYPEPQTGLHGL